jgi:hypothetical protein
MDESAAASGLNSGDKFVELDAEIFKLPWANEVQSPANTFELERGVRYLRIVYDCLAFPGSHRPISTPTT